MTRRLSIVVIGAGAAGMVAAATAARTGAEVIVLEKNAKTGVKILMSGGTRCNITQDVDSRGITEAFGSAKRFLQPSVGAFGPTDVIAMFNRLGVATKREDTGKIFPCSDRAVDVRDALHRQMIDAGASLRMKCPVLGIAPQGDQWQVHFRDDGTEQTMTVDRVIITSGGRSWPGCGTTGDAYQWLSTLGHTVVRPRPALVPLVGGTPWSRELSGLTLGNVVASVFESASVGAKQAKRPIVARHGGWLFTHFGFSGPAAMDVSGTMTATEKISQTRLRIDFLPDVPEPTLHAALTDRSGHAGRRSVSSVLSDWLPSRLAAAISQASDATLTNGHERPLSELSKVTLQTLLNTVKSWDAPIHDTRGFDKAEVTAGGVSLHEVNPRTMASKRHPGLYLAGEVLDVDGWIGGYNFQAAFSTGRVAGLTASMPQSTPS